MKKKLTVSLDEKAYQRLLDLCGGDENLLEATAARILEGHFSESGSPQSETELDTKGLEDYLKKSPSGKRSYGIKGQGW